jgi:hypothetical protein
MKFAHLADCHVGAWREPLLRVLTEQAFANAIDICIQERVDFVIIAGDLFHTALPPLDGVKTVFRALTCLHDRRIPLYFITGSHDYSPSGKTMLDLIEEAGIGRNLFRGSIREGRLRLTWTVDERTGVKLTGILGRANQLDHELYTDLDRESLEKESGTKIFVFHTGVAELTTEAHYDRAPASLLPSGCTYYAGGHVHTRSDNVIEGKRIVYPGPLFPASFSELEELGAGSFVIVEDSAVRRVEVKTKRVITHRVDGTSLEPLAVAPRILESLTDITDAIVLVRATGTLRGRPADVDWKRITDELLARGAYAVLRNTAALAAPERPRVNVSVGSVNDIESAVLAEQNIDITLARELIHSLATEMRDGEKRQQYVDRVVSEGVATLTRAITTRDSSSADRD